MTEDLITAHVLIAGRVQGVGYRAWCVGQAEARGLSGWVRNLKSGAVEAVFTGEADKIVDIMDVLWEGPSFARVTSVEDLTPVASASGPFEVRTTA